MPTVSLALGDRSYDIIVENGSLDLVGTYSTQAGLKGKIAIITDTNVAPLYMEKVLKSFTEAGFTPSIHAIQAGEASKNLFMVQQLCSALAQAGIDRSGNIAALGGGVVGDLAGFVASVHYRGIPFIQIPTTIVSQVDSSIGGKTAVNIPEGKNLVGAFHQPKLVVVDPTTLQTLDKRILAEGLAEAIKHAAIRDLSMIPELLKLGQELETGFSSETINNLPDLIARNVAIKARIVESDEEEKLGIRALLNFGHTIGHGIEASLPYGEILHGEAVALGMRAALFLSERYGNFNPETSKQIIEVMKSMGLPLTLSDDISDATVMKKTASDKKYEAGAIRFVLLNDNNTAYVSNQITEQDIQDAITHLRTPC